MTVYVPSPVNGRRARATRAEMQDREVSLRKLVRDAIERHVPRQQVEVVRVAEESERAGLTTWGQQLAGQEGGR